MSDTIDHSVAELKVIEIARELGRERERNVELERALHFIARSQIMDGVTAIQMRAAARAAIHGRRIP